LPSGRIIQLLFFHRAIQPNHAQPGPLLAAVGCRYRQPGAHTRGARLPPRCVNTPSGRYFRIRLYLEIFFPVTRLFICRLASCSARSRSSLRPNFAKGARLHCADSRLVAKLIILLFIFRRLSAQTPFSQRPFNAHLGLRSITPARFTPCSRLWASVGESSSEKQRAFVAYPFLRPERRSSTADRITIADHAWDFQPCRVYPGLHFFLALDP